MVLTPTMGVQALDTDMKGPLQRDTIGIVLGRSSSTMRGLFVLPGVIDSDYTGTIKVMCHSPKGIVSIAPGDRIAQLLLLPSLHGLFPAKSRQRGNLSMGSSGVDLACLSMSLDSRPVINLTIERKVFSGLLDTGADHSIIQSDSWPKAWPLQRASQSLQGLGYAETPAMSAKELTWHFEEQKGRFQPFVVKLPINLWGRDIQQQLGLQLTNEYSPESQAMINKNKGIFPLKAWGNACRV